MSEDAAESAATVKANGVFQPRRATGPGPGPYAAITTYFFVNGLVLGTWASQTPAVVESIDLSHVELGTGLFAMAIGALIAFQLSAWVSARWNTAIATRLFGFTLVIALVPLAMVDSVWTLFLALLFLGVGNGGLDVAQNAQAIEVENSLNRHLLSKLHGWFSAGGLVAAAVTAAAPHLGASYTMHFLIVASIGLFAMLVASRELVGEGKLAPAVANECRGRFDIPFALLALGIIALSSSVAEGSMSDWGALFVTQEHNASLSTGAMAYGAFGLAMTVGRFVGDSLRSRFNPVVLVIASALVGGGGLGIALGIISPVASILGFAIVGAGVSLISPLAYAAAAQYQFLPTSRSVAFVATMGYSGFLLGPPAIGFIAQQTTLRFGLCFVILMLMSIPVATLRSKLLRVEDKA